MPITPDKIKLEGGHEALAIQWSDGHQSAYGYQYLRDRCPCSTCTGAERPEQHQATASHPPLGIFRKVLKPERAELVGRYAVQIFWNDGHSAGIYTFPYLRGLCLCANCTAPRREDGEH